MAAFFLGISSLINGMETMAINGHCTNGQAVPTHTMGADIFKNVELRQHLTAILRHKSGLQRLELMHEFLYGLKSSQDKEQLGKYCSLDDIEFLMDAAINTCFSRKQDKLGMYIEIGFLLSMEWINTWLKNYMLEYPKEKEHVETENLHWFFISDQPALILYLDSLGIKFNKKNSKGRTSIMEALCHSAGVNTALLLIANKDTYGIDLETTDNEGSGVFSYAFRQRAISVIIALLNAHVCPITEKEKSLVARFRQSQSRPRYPLI